MIFEQFRRLGRTGDYLYSLILHCGKRIEIQSGIGQVVDFYDELIALGVGRMQNKSCVTKRPGRKWSSEKSPFCKG